MPERYDDIRKVHFEPSTVENIDRSVIQYVENLNMFVDTNEGFKKVPVLWGTSERSFLSKDKKDVRDDHGALIFPLVSVRRTSFSKSLRSSGAFQGNVPEANDEKGGSLEVSRTIYHQKTIAHTNQDSARNNEQRNYPGRRAKTIYRIVSAPMPVNVEMMYEITLRTEYQQQMNDLILPFITKPGTINYVVLKDAGHRYEGFIQEQYQSQDNLSSFEGGERKFETKINLKVIGYLVGQGKNREKPSYSIRESVVEVKIPRERRSTADIPLEELSLPEAPLVIPDNPGWFSEDTIFIKAILKSSGIAADNARIFVVPGATVKANSERLYVNDALQTRGASLNYTMSGNTITFNYDIVDSDAIYITYLKG